MARFGSSLVLFVLVAVIASTGIHSRVSAEGALVTAISRDEIDNAYKWDVASIFESDKEWEAEFVAMEGEIKSLDRFRGTLGNSAESLLSWFRQRDEVAQRFEILSVYASLRSDEDVRVTGFQDMDARAGKLGTTFGESTAWESPEIAAIDVERLRGFVDEEEGLEVYRFHVEEGIRARAHTLSPREEELMAMSSQALGSSARIAGMLRNADMDYPTIADEYGQDVELTSGRFEKFRTSKNVTVRRDAYLGMLGAYGTKANTLAAALSGAVEGHIFNARARGFESSLHAALFNHNIPVQVYHNLLESVAANIEPVHRYVSLRKKALGLDEMHYYDLYPSLAANPPGDISWDEGMEQVLQCVEVLGQEYRKDLDKGLHSGWVDVYENEGKRSGAYSHGAMGTKPFILMNYGNNVDGVFTLAHEAGHSMHTLESCRNQEYVNADYSIFVAEVASTALEALLQQQMVRQGEGSGVDEQIYLLDRFIKDMMGTVIRQTMFAEFELRIHEMAEEGETLTPDAMGEMYSGLVSKYYGPDMTIDPETAYTWARIPHFYYNFYVYQYATSYAASFAIAEQILHEKPGAPQRFLDLIAEGGSDHPIEQLKRAGVDMTTPQPIESAMRAFEEAVIRLEKLVDAS